MVYVKIISYDTEPGGEGGREGGRRNQKKEKKKVHISESLTIQVDDCEYKINFEHKVTGTLKIVTDSCC